MQTQHYSQQKTKSTLNILWKLHSEKLQIIPSKQVENGQTIIEQSIRYGFIHYFFELRGSIMTGCIFLETQNATLKASISVRETTYNY